jgi:hypothetical protein
MNFYLAVPTFMTIMQKDLLKAMGSGAFHSGPTAANRTTFILDGV